MFQRVIIFLVTFTFCLFAGAFTPVYAGGGAINSTSSNGPGGGVGTLPNIGGEICDIAPKTIGKSITPNTNTCPPPASLTAAGSDATRTTAELDQDPLVSSEEENVDTVTER